MVSVFNHDGDQARQMLNRGGTQPTDSFVSIDNNRACEGVRKEQIT